MQDRSTPRNRPRRPGQLADGDGTMSGATEGITLFVRATLKSGEQVISTFTKLKGISRYGSDVLSGRKSFNRWRRVSTAHPVSCGRVMRRAQEVISGSDI